VAHRRHGPDLGENGSTRKQCRLSISTNDDVAVVDDAPRPRSRRESMGLG